MEAICPVLRQLVNKIFLINPIKKKKHFEIFIKNSRSFYCEIIYKFWTFYIYIYF